MILIFSINFVFTNLFNTSCLIKIILQDNNNLDILFYIHKKILNNKHPN